MAISFPEVEAHLAVMQYSCTIRSKVAMDLEKTDTWSGTSWVRKLELVQAKAEMQSIVNPESVLRPSRPSIQRMSIHNLVALPTIQSTADEAAESKQLWLRKFRRERARACGSLVLGRAPLAIFECQRL